ncbi:glycosyltransferase family 4 protein [Candidatus Neomarinimicrobiota bacterium]
MSLVNEAMRTHLEETFGRVTVINLAPVSLSRRFIIRLARLVRVLSGFIKLLKSIQQWDLLYISPSGGIGQVYDLFFILTARILKRRIILHHHNYEYLDRHSALTALLSYIAGPQAVHVVMCEDMDQRLRGNYSRARKTVVLSHVAMQNYSPPDGVPRTRLRRIGFISNITYAKGIKEYLNVVARLEEMGAPVEAFLAGPFSDKYIRQDIELCLAQLSSLHYLGPVAGEKKLTFFQDIDVLLLPTHQESVGLVNLEAISQGVPLIVLARGCIPELFHPEAGVVITDRSDYVKIACRTIIAWVENPQAYQSASQKAYARFQALREHCTGQLEELMALMADRDR